MSTYSGWEGSVLIKESVSKEIVNTDEADNLSAIDETLVLYTHKIPVCDSSYDTTTTTSDLVAVYIGDEVDVKANVSALVGATGTITIDNSAGGANKGDNKVVRVSYYSKHSLGYAQNVSLTQNDNLQAVYAIGARSPKEIKEGRIEIDGTIGYLWIDRGLLGWIHGTGTSADPSTLVKGALSTFDMELSPDGGTTTFTITDCKLGTYSLNVTEDGITAENVTFKGLAVSIS